MITIDQLLESVDLDFEPRWVTKDSDEEDGCICAWDTKPTKQLTYWQKTDSKKDKWAIIGYIKAAEFENKPWQECIYEVPRKTTGKIEKIFIPETDVCADSAEYSIELAKRLNQVIDAVNELNAKFALPTLNPDLTDEDLRKMMCDPKYWRDNDSATIQKVQNGFNKLYGDKN